MRLLTRPASAEATCSSCHARFLVEADSAGVPCQCPHCGEEALAPPPPVHINRAAYAGVAAIAVLGIGVTIWLATAGDTTEAAPTAPAEVAVVPASPEPKATYRPTTDLPKVAASSTALTADPAIRVDDFSSTSAQLLLAQNEPNPQRPPAKQAETPDTPVSPAVGDAPEIKELNEAIAAFRRQDLNATRALLAEAAKAHPELPPVPFMLGELLLSANQFAPARQELEQAVTKYPRFAGSYLLFGNLALAEGRVTDAALEFEKARSLENETSDPGRRKKIQAAVRMGLVTVHEIRQDWAAARACAEEWLTFEPGNTRAHQRLAKSLVALGKTQEAVRELEQVSVENKAEQPAEAAMAAFYSELGDQKSAETWLGKALAAHPKNFRVAMFAGAWYLERERPDEAQPQAVRAQQLDPTSVDAKLMCAVVARQQRNFREAEKWLESATRDAPANFSVSNQLALVLAEQEDEQKRRRAMELAEVNARQYPRSADAASTLGWAYYRGGKIDQAEQALQAAVSNGRASSDTAYFFAHVLAERGKLDAAARLLQDAVQATGPFTYRNEAKQWLERITGRPGKEPAKESAQEPAKK